MNAKTCLAVLLLISTSIAQGQKLSNEFGIIGKDDVELQQYFLDENAEALVLFDKAKTFFNRSETSFDLVFERSTRIKILSEAGIKWAEIEIPFYQEGGIYEKVFEVEAYTYNFENGRLNKIPFDVSNTYNEKINNHWSVKKFVLPNVKEGSIIEYRYKINSQYIFNLRDWEFQWKIPVVYSEYEVKMIPFYEYSWLLQGAKSFDSYNSFMDKGLSRQFYSITFQDMVHQYIMKDIPAFENEEFITSINDYIIKLDFQLAKINYPNGSSRSIITSWEEMNKALLKHTDFGKHIKKTEKIASKIVSNEAIDLKTDKEKFDFALDYVKKNFNWNKMNSKYASKSPKKLMDEKHGNCADINLFTIGLLNALGIDAKPLLISTRDNGKIKFDYPYTHFFNYVIILAEVDGNQFLADGTEVLALNNRIPSRCINDKGLVVQNNKVEWVGLECMFPSEIKTEIQIEIMNDKIINTSLSKTATEYDALFFRNHYTDDIETVKKRVENDKYTLIDTTIIVKNQLDREQPYIVAYNLISKPEIINEKIYLSPFLNEIISDNPLKQKTRSYPIDMTYPKQRSFHSTIRIPEGYQVEYVPTDQTIHDPLFELASTYSIEHNKIKATFTYNFRESVYSSMDYTKIKFYFDEIVKNGNEKLVFSKILKESN